jgi:hypothetical protein
MSATTPIIGRTAVIKIGTQEIGYCKDVTVSIDVGLIKEYFISGTNPDRPAFVASGNKSFKVSIKRAYIDNTYATDVLNGSPVTVSVLPQGTGTGKPQIDVSNVAFTGWELSIAQDGVILESIKGEGKDITFTTQA